MFTGANQVFTATGGVGSYTFTIPTHPSGATFTSTGTATAPGPTVTYHAGSTGGVTDHIQVADAHGTSVQAYVTVQVPPDHIAIIAGNGDQQAVGSRLSPAIKARVYDAAGNPYSATPTSFALVALQGSDARNRGAPVASADANGYIQFDVNLGFAWLSDIFQIVPVGFALPDVTGTGGTHLTFTETLQPAATTGWVAGAILSGGGQSAQAVVPGDFDGDGKLDLAVASYGGSETTVFLGHGDGTFHGAANYAVSNNSFAAAAGDLNGDGHLDLAVVSQLGVDLLLGNGDGTFQTTTLLASSDSPIDLALADFNADGNLDLVVATRSAKVSVYLGKGDGTFQAKKDITTVAGNQALAVGDFNGDGKLDLAVLSYSNSQVTILLGNGDGTFQSKATYAADTNPTSAVAADFDGDGKLDLAISNNGTGLRILRGGGDGTFVFGADYAADSTPTRVRAGDLNGDGKLDLVVSNYNSDKLSVFLGNGNGTFQAKADQAVGLFPNDVALGDFNGDGKLDLASPDASGGASARILLGN